MKLEQGTVDDVLTRLRRIEGQVGGIIKMIEDGRECRDVIRQVSAVSSALDQAGFKMIASGMRTCIRDERAAKRSGYSDTEFEKLFLSLA